MLYINIYEALRRGLIMSSSVASMHPLFLKLVQFAHQHKYKDELIPLDEVLQLFKEHPDYIKDKDFYNTLASNYGKQSRYVDIVELKKVIVETATDILSDPRKDDNTKLTLLTKIVDDVNNIEEWSNTSKTNFDNVTLSSRECPITFFNDYFKTSPGDIIFFLGYKKIGKSTFVGELVYNDLLAGKEVCIFDYANGEVETLVRFASYYFRTADIDEDQLNKFKLTDEYKAIKKNLTYIYTPSKGVVANTLKQKFAYVIFDDIHKASTLFDKEFANGMYMLYNWLYRLMAKTQNTGLVMTHPNSKSATPDSVVPVGGERMSNDLTALLYYSRVTSEEFERKKGKGQRELYFTNLRKKAKGAVYKQLLGTTPYSYKKLAESQLIQGGASGSFDVDLFKK